MPNASAVHFKVRDKRWFELSKQQQSEIREIAKKSFEQNGDYWVLGLLFSNKSMPTCESKYIWTWRRR